MKGGRGGGIVILSMLFGGRELTCVKYGKSKQNVYCLTRCADMVNLPVIDFSNMYLDKWSLKKKYLSKNRSCN